MVYKKRKGWQRTQFRKLPVGSVYWLASALTVAPSVKSGGRTLQGGVTISTGTPTNTTVADGTVAVVKVPGQFMHGVR